MRNASDGNGILRGAHFSRCGRYRYALRRTFGTGQGTVLFVGLNPSTADGRVDDPTIRRCMGFARSWGYGELWVGNLFALRTPHPRVLLRAEDPVGPRNDRWLADLARRADRVIVAWGNHGDHLGRAACVAPRLGYAECLACNGTGQPVHPLYQPARTRPRPWSAPESASPARQAG